MSSGTGGLYPAPVVAGESAGVNAAFQPFPYPGTQQAAQSALTGIQNEFNPAMASSLTNAAQNAITQGQSVYGGGQGLYDWAYSNWGIPVQAGTDQYNALTPYVTKALQAGFDPQNALYNQQYNLQQQQNLASEAMSGVGQSPYAAGLTAQGDQNFNIAWQASELARQQQAAQTAGGLSQAAMNAMLGGWGEAGQMGQIGMNALAQGAQGLEGLYGTAGNLAAQAQGLQGNQIAQYLAYLQASTQNAANAISGQLGTLGQGTNLYSATTGANQGLQSLINQGLGGLGSLGGTLGGAYLNSSALNNLASSIGNL